MMMLGGSPIRVAVPPMFEAITSAMRNGAAGRPSRSHTSSVTGATSSTVVTLSKPADATAVMTTRITMTGYGRPRARFTAQIARYSNSPVRRSTATMSIMPMSSMMTFQSMPASGEKNACSASVAPMSSISAAPPSAAATRCTHSVAIRMYAATKMATAIQAMVVIEPSTRSSSRSRVTAPSRRPVVDHGDQRAVGAGHQRRQLQHGGRRGRPPAAPSVAAAGIPGPCGRRAR